MYDLSLLQVKRNFDLGNGADTEEFIKNHKGKINEAMGWVWDENDKTITNVSTSQMIDLRKVTPAVRDQILENFKEDRDKFLLPFYALILLSGGSGMSRGIGASIGKTTPFVITPEITAWIKGISKELTRQLNGTTLLNINNIIKDSLKFNYSVNETSFLLKQVIPVNVNEARSLQLLYSKLTKSGKLKPFEIRNIMNAKKNQFIKNRADRIARTEITRIKRRSEIEAVNQSIRAGKLKKATKTWVQSNFKDNWDTSVFFNGVTVDVNKDFTGFFGNTSMVDFSFPSEINEKCFLDYRGVS